MNKLGCTIFKPSSFEYDRISLGGCTEVCGDTKRKADETQTIRSVMCVGKVPAEWTQYTADIQAASGSCVCDSSFVNELATSIVEALPIIAEIGCNLWTASVNWVLSLGTLVLPGPGRVITGAMLGLIEAAKISAEIYEATGGGKTEFTNWLVNGCGTTNLPPGWANVFDTLSKVDGALLPKGFKVPKGLPKEKPKNEAAPPKKTDGPDISKEGSSKTTQDSSEGASTASACPRAGARKRAPGGAQSNCNFGITSILSSVAVATTTVTKVCSGAAWPQACYHYHSVIHHGHLDNHLQAKSGRMTCGDSNAREKFLTAVEDYNKQHHTAWLKYAMPVYKFHAISTLVPVRCQRDEFPPAFFLKRGAGDQQWIRVIPGSENGGAGSMWRDFCTNNDGGTGNGQIKNGEINSNVVDTKNMKVLKKEVNAKTTTTFVEAKFTRAVFEMSFDRQWTVQPEINDWGLKLNPCWPEDATPTDPGFVLLLDDPWYKSQKQSVKDITSLYSESMSPQVTKDADARRAQRQNAPPPVQQSATLTVDDDDEDLASGLAGLGLKPRAEASDAHNLDLLSFNKRDSSGEKRAFHAIPCKDRTCSYERRHFGKGIAILNPRHAGATPRDNPQSRETVVPAVPSQPEIKFENSYQVRELPLPDLPSATMLISPRTTEL